MSEHDSNTNAPTRVALFLPNLEIGGAEVLVLDLLSEYLKRPGLEFHLILLGGGGKLVEKAKRLRSTFDSSFTFAEFGLPLRPGIAAARTLNRYLVTRKIHVLHSHLYDCDKVSFLAKLLNPRLRIVVTKHNVYQFGPRTSAMIFLSQFLFSRIVFISTVQREFYRRRYLVFRNSTLIMNGCRIPREKTGARTVSGRPRLACIGSLGSKKGQDILIDALNLLSERGAAYQCDFFGDGPDREALQARAAGNPDIHFHPAKMGIADELGDFDLVIIPSRREGFCLLALECFLAKTPLIVSDYPILAEHADNGGRAITFQSENFRDLAEKIDAFLKDPLPHASMVEAAYRYALGFSIEKTAEKYLRVYREAAGMQPESGNRKG